MLAPPNQPSACALLLTHQADLRARNDQGMTVFHLATFLGSLSLVQVLTSSLKHEKILLQAINQGDLNNQTPLFYACLEGHTDVALALLRAVL
ncbi:MAG: ankyrin repeat domain-containing protein, partial [Nostocaceae cyanobacterium CSU_2_110]|nr:ankyrin repeat domain-containing protein [Nostocaceae cyanobacterium CSU_2_110]